MKIDQIILGNFKGQNGKVTLDRLNLLVGPNGSGKSAHLQAIRWAIEGTSEHGQAPRAALPYAGRNGMAAGLVMDNGLAFTRRLKIEHLRNKPTTTPCSLSVPGVDMTSTDAEAHVANAVGGFAPMFDLGVFLNQSTEKRTQAVLKLCADAVTSDGKAVGSRIALEWFKGRIGAGVVAEIVAQYGPWPFEKLVKKVGEDECDALDKCQTLMRIKGSATAVIEGATEEVKKLIAASKRAKDEALQASNELSARQRSLEVPAGTAEQLREKREGLVAQKEDVIRQIGDQEGRDKARTSLVEQEGWAANALVKLHGQRVDAGEHGKTLKSEADAKRLDDQAVAIDAELPEEADVSALEEAAKAATRVLGQAEVDSGTASHSQDLADLTYKAATKALKEAEASPWTAMKALLRELERQVARSDIPEPWAAVWAHVNAQSDDLAKLQQVEYHAKERFHDAGVGANRIHSELTGARTARENADNLLGLGRDANHDRRQSVLKRNDLLSAAAAIRNALTQHAQNVERLNGEIEAAEKTRLDLERQINRLAEGAGVPIATLEQQQDGFVEAIAKVDADVKAKDVAQGVATQLAECVAKKDRETVTYDVARGVAEAIKIVRTEYMAELVAPLVDKLNAVLGRLDGARTAHCRLVDVRGQPAFALGWSDGTTEVSLEAMSGGEQVLFSVCLLYALVMLADPPLKLLMIEAGELDDDALLHLLHAIGTLTTGDATIGNVLVATCHPVERGSKYAGDWNVIELGAPVKAAVVA